MASVYIQGFGMITVSDMITHSVHNVEVASIWQTIPVYQLIQTAPASTIKHLHARPVYTASIHKEQYVYEIDKLWSIIYFKIYIYS